MSNHKNLAAWKEATALVIDLYKTTRDFPKSETYGISSQIRKAAVSISANIAEGAARSSNRQYVQFLYYSLGSASEIETLLLISKNLEYIDPQTHKELDQKTSDVRSKLIKLIRYLKTLPSQKP